MANTRARPGILRTRRPPQRLGELPVPVLVRVSDKLNWIAGSFTVAAWVKPETDYVSGTGWNWSFGRQGLWRLGFYGPAQGLRFEVVQLTQPYATHFAQA